eukprot:gene1967-biopygen1858
MVVKPRWPGQPWSRELEALASEVAFMPQRRDLFTPSWLGGSEPCFAFLTVRQLFLAGVLDTYRAGGPAPCRHAAGGGGLVAAEEQVVLLYMGVLLRRGTVTAGSVHPYLSAINNYHEDLGVDKPAKGRAVARGGEHSTSVLRKEKGRQQVRMKCLLVTPLAAAQGLL